MPLVSQVNLQDFEKWEIYFVGPIDPPGKKMGACYIITMTYYLTRWDEAALVKDCTTVTTALFLFYNVVIRFSCPNILISDQGTHFANHLIDKLTK